MIRKRAKADGSKNKTDNGRLAWSNEETVSFESVKKSNLTEPSAFFNESWETTLEVDASSIGAASKLFQIYPKDRSSKRVIAYWSQAFSEIERRYSQVEREALAVTLACEKHRVFLIGAPFLLLTDNRAVQLIYGNANSSPPPRIMRFNLRLLEYEFEIRHKPGKDNAADYLSRHPVDEVDTERMTWLAEQFVHGVTQTNAPRAIPAEEIAAVTATDPILTTLMTATSVSPSSASLRTSSRSAVV